MKMEIRRHAVGESHSARVLGLAGNMITRIIMMLVLIVSVSALTVSDVAAQASQIKKTQTLSIDERRELNIKLKNLITTGGGGVKAVCSSTDNKKACACGEDPCIAGATTCGCIKVTPPPSSN
jgi:hypothetical protein